MGITDRSVAIVNNAIPSGPQSLSVFLCVWNAVESTVLWECISASFDQVRIPSSRTLAMTVHLSDAVFVLFSHDG